MGYQGKATPPIGDFVLFKNFIIFDSRYTDFKRQLKDYSFLFFLKCVD